MRIDDIIELHRRRPFLPFKIQLADGRAYTVDRPEYFARSRGGRTVIFHTQDEHVALIDVAQITALGPVADSSGPPAAGE